MIVCVVGVVNRSIQYTWESIKDNIIDELKKGHKVDIAVFNNNVGDTLVDGVLIDNNSMSIIPYDFMFQYKQATIDGLVRKIPGYDRDFTWFRGRMKRNGVRHMYVEGQVAKFLTARLSKYQYAVVTNGDYFYSGPLPPGTLGSIKRGMIGTCHHLDASGYTDGFYIGHIADLVKVLSRISYYQRMLNCFDSGWNGGHRDPPNYESFLKLAFELSDIERLKVEISFVKIRSNLRIEGDRRDGSGYAMLWAPAIEKYKIFLSENKDRSENYMFLYNRLMEGGFWK